LTKRFAGPNPGEGEGFLRATKIPQNAFFWRGSKVGGFMSKDLGHIKEIFVNKIHNFLRPDPLDLLLDDSAGRIARERFGGRIRSFASRHHYTMVLYAHISREV
jgi:hypothetical protein